MREFDSRIGCGDLTLFAIESQTSDRDRKSLLLAQSLIRSYCGKHNYLEIGSHLGGTLLPYLKDPRCLQVHSVDPRPLIQPDERGRSYEYVENSTSRMIEQLQTHCTARELEKLTTWNFDVSKIPSYSYGCRFDIALIDGEHTNQAAFRDFVYIVPALQRDALIVFHDANIIIDAILNVETLLRSNGTDFTSFVMPDCVAIIALRGIIDLAKGVLGPSSLERAAYLEYSRREIAKQIASNADAVARGEAPSLTQAPAAKQQ